MINIKNLTKKFGKTAVLDGISLTVKRGDRIALIGPNGGGKTTLLRLILGLVRPDVGSIHVLGTSPTEARPRVGYVPQSAELDSHFPISLRDVVLMGRLGVHRRFGPYRRSDKAIADEALAEMGLSDLRWRSFASLSGWRVGSIRTFSFPVGEGRSGRGSRGRARRECRSIYGWI